MDEEAREIRKRKLEEMQKAKEQEEKVRATLRTVLDEDAYERLINVKVANPSLYAGAVQGCVALYQRLGRKLGDRELLFILKRLKIGSEETKITFERK